MLFHHFCKGLPFKSFCGLLKFHDVTFLHPALPVSRDQNLGVAVEFRIFPGKMFCFQNSSELNKTC